MTQPTPITPVIRHPAWKVWANPIFRRYCQSRLRVRGLSIFSLIVVLIAGFIVALTHSIGINFRVDPADSARSAIIPLIVLQGFILFVLGTAQVAGGITAERDEGVIDYQRLIPMSPLAKVIGYLFGLPVREYVLFLLTLPFSAWVLWRGQVAPNTWLPLYAVILLSALLYHFTGLLTGTVVRNRRWAFLVSIGLVFALYTVIPQMSKFGLVVFRYLTIRPVLDEALPGLLPAKVAEGVAVYRQFAVTAKFFNLDFSEIVFTAFSQGGLILTFIVMLCRKWRRSESHLLGKLWATGFFIWIQVLLLGNAIPLIDPGNLFPSRAFTRMARILPDWKPNSGEAVAMSAIYGLVTLGLLLVLAGIITPSRDSQRRGWRRLRKIGASGLNPMEDAATSFWFVLIMALAGATGWFLFAEALVESRWFPGHMVDVHVLFYFAAVMLAAGIGFQALLEAKGGRAVGFAAIFIGAVPVMAAIVMIFSKPLHPVASLIAGISPVTLTVYAPASLLSLSELPATAARAIPRAFHFWLFVSLIATIWLIIRLRAARAQLAAKPNPPPLPLAVE